eukprot:4684354-Amphidinium_carterae.1
MTNAMPFDMEIEETQWSNNDDKFHYNPKRQHGGGIAIVNNKRERAGNLQLVSLGSCSNSLKGHSMPRVTMMRVKGVCQNG